MKKILFILFVAQFILAPYIIKGYGANLVEDNYEYSGVDQGRETVEKDILAMTNMPKKITHDVGNERAARASTPTIILIEKNGFL